MYTWCSLGHITRARPHGTRKMRAPSYVAFSPANPTLFALAHERNSKQAIDHRDLLLRVASGICTQLLPPLYCKDECACCFLDSLLIAE